MATQSNQNNVTHPKNANREFEEIAHSGGRIEFVRENGQVKGIKVSNNIGGVIAFQLVASANGQIRDIVQFQGYMPDGPPPPERLVPVWMMSDIEGLFGRTCPECKSPFRTNCVTEDTACPYCGHWDHCLAFTTQNQQEYITQYCKLFIETLDQQKGLIVDLSELALTENRPQWMYSEERQQNRFDCKNCGTPFDVLGEYAGCPKCGKRNYKEIINAKLDALVQKLQTALDNLTDRDEQEVEWGMLSTCVSEFDAMANDLRRQLLRLPATPRRKTQLLKLSFQGITKANDSLNNWFGFEILKGISDQDRAFMNRMFNRRHIFTHNAGRVDQKYLDNTGDKAVKLNQVIRIKSSEIKQLVPLIRQAANNLIEGYESIS